MNFVLNKFNTNDPLVLYNYCLNYMLSYQRKKLLIYNYLEKLSYMFNHQLCQIINICIHNINNLEYKQIYIHHRNEYLKYIVFLVFMCKYKENDTPLIKSNKYIHNSIINRFYSDKISLIKKFNDCILFVDKVLNIFNHSPNIKYIIKGDLIEPNQYINYSNVCEVIEVKDELSDDDINRLPPKKRYRK